MAPWIRCKKLVIGHKGQALSKEINYDFIPGRVYFIHGGNGCGKSTFLRTLLGLNKAEGGQVENTKSRSMSYLMQGKVFSPGVAITLHEYLAMGLRGKTSPKNRRDRIQDVVNRFGLEGQKRRDVSKLSGGQFQRANLARTFCTDADILALDEPGVGLDADGLEMLGQEITAQAQLGKLVLLVSHKLAFATKLADKSLGLKDGRLVEESAS